LSLTLRVPHAFTAADVSGMCQDFFAIFHVFRRGCDFSPSSSWTTQISVGFWVFARILPYFVSRGFRVPTVLFLSLRRTTRSALEFSVFQPYSRVATLRPRSFALDSYGERWFFFLGRLLWRGEIVHLFDVCSLCGLCHRRHCLRFRANVSLDRSAWFYESFSLFFGGFLGKVVVWDFKFEDDTAWLSGFCFPRGQFVSLPSGYWQGPGKAFLHFSSFLPVYLAGFSLEPASN